MLGSSALIRSKISYSLKLQVASSCLISGKWLYVTVGEDFETIRIEQLAEVSLIGGGIFHAEKTVIKSDFCFDGMATAEPVESTLYLAIGARQSATALRVILCIYFLYLSIVSLAAACTLDDVGIFEPDLFAWSKAEVFFRSVFHEVLALYPKLAAESDFMGTEIGILWVVDGLHLLSLSFRIIGNSELERM